MDEDFFVGAVFATVIGSFQLPSSQRYQIAKEMIYLSSRCVLFCSTDHNTNTDIILETDSVPLVVIVAAAVTSDW